jgi:hypothetical protein
VETKEVKTINLANGHTQLFSENDKDVGHQWLTENQLLWTRTGDDGKSELWIGTAGTESKK